VFFFELGRRGTGENNLVDPLFELPEVERAVVEGTRQAETIVDQRLLAAAIAAPHPADLRNRHVAFVDDQQVITGEVVE
jgi:hypothetical protein